MVDEIASKAKTRTRIDRPACEPLDSIEATAGAVARDPIGLAQLERAAAPHPRLLSTEAGAGDGRVQTPVAGPPVAQRKGYAAANSPGRG
jgi:hypothetical protein